MEHIDRINAIIRNQEPDMPVDCKFCVYNGGQCWYPSNCTGCGGNYEYRNFVRK